MFEIFPLTGNPANFHAAHRRFWIRRRVGKKKIRFVAIKNVFLCSCIFRLLQEPAKGKYGDCYAFVTSKFKQIKYARRKKRCVYRGRTHIEEAFTAA